VTIKEFKIIITDVKVTNANGNHTIFLGTAERNVKMLPSGFSFMEFTSALGTPLGLVGLGPGVIVEYSNQVASSSQIDSKSGLVKLLSEGDQS
jgi:hypothetical protein